MTMAGLVPIESKLFDARDGVLLAEAMVCRDVKAFRGAYILTWIAVAEGLKWRFAELTARDRDMAKFVAETERIERDGGTIDQRLLDQAKKSGLVSDAEFKQLTYLKDMRNSFAHPTGAAPSLEDVQAALGVAITLVLSRPPLLGFGYVADLAVRVMEDIHYLDDVKEKVEDYGKQLAPRLQRDAVPRLVGALIKRLGPVIADPQMAVYTRRAVWLSRELVRQAPSNINATPWRVEAWLGETPTAAALILAEPEIFPRLDSRLSDSVFGNIIEPVSGGKVVPPNGESLQVALALRDSGFLDGPKEARLVAALGRTPYVTLQHNIPLRDWAYKAVTDLLARNWYVQNPAAVALASVSAEGVATCDAATVEQLGRALLAAADGTASEAQQLIARLCRNDGSIWPSSFIGGLLLECVVHEHGKFRVKSDELSAVLEIVSAHPDAARIEATAIGAIASSSVEGGGREMYDHGLYQLKALDLTGDACVLRERLALEIEHRRDIEAE
jgi:hypothetical protein